MKRLVLIPALLLFAPMLLAETPEAKGLRIAQQSDASDMGWKDQRANLRMILRDRHGRESIRETRNRTLEVQSDGDKSLIVFDSPRDIQGTAFLSHTHVNRADDQWLYLKSIRRVKRISSNNKSGPFMGSEFSYEDISSQEVGKYSYKFLKDDKHNGRATWLIEQIPKYKYSGYTRILTWMDKKMLRPVKAEFYDRKNSLLKTVTYHGYKQYKKKYWRQAKMHMVNHQTGKSTTLLFLKYQFDNNFDDSDFDINALKRIR